LCIEANPTELDKMFSVRARQINQTHIPAVDDFPAKLQIVQRQSDLHRKNVDCAQGKKTQGRAAARESVRHVISRPIASGRNDSCKAFLNGTPGQRFRFARMRRNADWAIADN
jgi:hypothetical protein